MSEYAELPWSVGDTIENIKEIKDIMKKKVLLQNLHGRGKKDAEEIDFDFNRAINALEEIQKYREIGTVEEIIHANAIGLVDKVQLEKYKAIGTVEEIRSAVEKQKEVRNKAIDDFVKIAMKQFTDFDLKHGYPTVTDCKVILRDIAEQLKVGGVNE